MHQVMEEHLNLVLQHQYQLLVVELEVTMVHFLEHQEDLELELLMDLQEHRILLEKELQDKVTMEDLVID